MNGDEFSALWRNAIPMSEAWLEHAPADELEVLAALPRFADASIGDLRPGDVSAFFMHIRSGWDNSQAVMAKESELRELLLDRLYDGELLAIGYQTSPRPSRRPVLINPDYFDAPTIDWNKSSLAACGFQYESVRIIPYDRNLSEPNEKRAIGRPSRRNDILSAINSVAERDPQFCTHRRKVAVQLVRDALDSCASNKGLGDKTLEKYISDFCRGE